MKPNWAYGLGELFEHRSKTGKPITFHLSRPLDIDREKRLSLDLPTLAGLVRDTAGVLNEVGVKSGDRVVVYKANHFDCILLAAAAARIGAVPVMLSGMLLKEAVHGLIRRVEPTAIVSDGSRIERADISPEHFPDLKGRILSVNGVAPHARSFLDIRSEPCRAAVARRDDQLLMLTHTSGTTGLPKLVIFPPSTIQKQMARLECRHFPPLTFRRNDVVAMFTPYVHARAFTWIYSVLTLSPATVLLMDDNVPDVVDRMFRVNKPTFVEALPMDYTSMEPLLRTGADNPFSDVRVFVGNFDAVRWPVIRRYLNATGHPFPLWREGYGQSETGGMGMTVISRRSANRPRDHKPGPRIVGRPMPGFVQLKVVDPKSFAPVERGRPGLVLAKTKARCAGYYGEMDRWAEKVIGDWWNTGDLGILTQTGALRIIDREVNAASGIGYLEFEDTLVDRLPEGIDVAVLPRPDGPPLPIVASRGGRLNDDDWTRACTGLPELSEPVVIAAADMPRTATGKIVREELRRRYLDTVATPGSGRWT
ncbi:class I adenylate-forming enzyme family protein [Nocardia sp. NBC_01327]|uniref:class I adenylate-forming enzyme family protein n=1 Tax=Nocardia sp. NBC_01327 TaxID=2903593 RepID=UPI002E0E67D7|nr:AMP-binding protein [Nocardia sp. NBC_01327]